MECHVDQLRLAITDADPRELARQAGAVDNEYVVQKIHAHRKVRNTIHYLVEWGGFKDKSSFTWEPRSNLAINAGEILARYEALFSLAP